VFGNYAYHWHFWNGKLIDAVYTPRFVQFMIQRDDGSELIVKEVEYPAHDKQEIQPGHDVCVVGLGDRTKGDMYYFCGILDTTSGTVRHLTGWIQQFDWKEAHQYFGWRTRREAKDAVRRYYTAVLEVLARCCYGPLGPLFEEQVVPEAERAAKNWRFSF